MKTFLAIKTSFWELLHFQSICRRYCCTCLIEIIKKFFAANIKLTSSMLFLPTQLICTSEKRTKIDDDSLVAYFIKDMEWWWSCLHTCVHFFDIFICQIFSNILHWDKNDAKLLVYMFKSHQISIVEIFSQTRL